MEFEELPYSIKAVLSFNDPFAFLSTKNNAAFSFILYSMNNRNTFLQKIKLYNIFLIQKDQTINYQIYLDYHYYICWISRLKKILEINSINVDDEKK